MSLDGTILTIFQFLYETPSIKSKKLNKKKKRKKKKIRKENA